MTDHFNAPAPGVENKEQPTITLFKTDAFADAGGRQWHEVTIGCLRKEKKQKGKQHCGKV